MKTIILIFLFSILIQAQSFNLIFDDEVSWSPLKLTTLVSWYKGDIPLETFGNGVKWVGQSGGGEIAYTVAGTNGANPTTGTSDGHITLIFDGINDFLKDTITIAQPITIYMVMKQITWTQDDDIMNGQGNVALLRQNDATPKLYTYSGAAFSCANANLAIDTWGILRFVVNGASSSIRIDDNAATTGTAQTGSMTRFCVGAYVAANEGFADYSNIEVAEIIICSGTVTAGDDANVMAYFHNKYPSLPQ
jgi:hypothetical protein